MINTDVLVLPQYNFLKAIEKGSLLNNPKLDALKLKTEKSSLSSFSLFGPSDRVRKEFHSLGNISPIEATLKYLSLLTILQPNWWDNKESPLDQVNKQFRALGEAIDLLNMSPLKEMICDNQDRQLTWKVEFPFEIVSGKRFTISLEAIPNRTLNKNYIKAYLLSSSGKYVNADIDCRLSNVKLSFTTFETGNAKLYMYYENELIQEANHELQINPSISSNQLTLNLPKSIKTNQLCTGYLTSKYNHLSLPNDSKGLEIQVKNENTTIPVSITNWSFSFTPSTSGNFEVKVKYGGEILTQYITVVTEININTSTIEVPQIVNIGDNVSIRVTLTGFDNSIVCESSPNITLSCNGSNLAVTKNNNYYEANYVPNHEGQATITLTSQNISKHCFFNVVAISELTIKVTLNNTPYNFVDSLQQFLLQHKINMEVVDSANNADVVLIFHSWLDNIVWNETNVFTYLQECPSVILLFGIPKFNFRHNHVLKWKVPAPHNIKSGMNIRNTDKEAEVFWFSVLAGKLDFEHFQEENENELKALASTIAKGSRNN